MTSTDRKSSISTTLSPNNTLTQHSFEPASKIDQHVRYQLQEEYKALFFRTRNNTTELYEELIIRL
ncbi:4584_t:CDS:2 [Funneliformis mosseae]|uniref:4584_t:CDS:1 n=1 Tax=Funneliformis mosseae TaxID=27381 RepID=A0A9N9H5F4_FUNMO|nr:4584_t:CDS:2 [Funneliformis mosseae]